MLTKYSRGKGMSLALQVGTDFFFFGGGGETLYGFIDRTTSERWQDKVPQATAVRPKPLYVYWANGHSGGKVFDDQQITTVSMIYSLGTMNVCTIFDSSLMAVEMFQPGSQCWNDIASVGSKIQTQMVFLWPLPLIFTSWLTQHFIVCDVIITQMWLNLHHPHTCNTATFLHSTCKKPSHLVAVKLLYCDAILC